MNDYEKLKKETIYALNAYNHALNIFNHSDPKFIDECTLEVKAAKDRYNILIKELKNFQPTPEIESNPSWLEKIKSYLF
jgi:hypothetical protein